MEIDTDCIDCHGGITYGENYLHCQDDTDRFWIGFDCYHYCDLNNEKSLEYCEAQCKYIVEQLIELEERK